MKWFKHDTDASIDAKLQELLLDYGASGYGLYWYCVELIAQNVDEKNITFELEHDARIIARNLNLTVQETKDMMSKMIELELFGISKNEKLACYTLAKRLDQSMTSNKGFRAVISKIKDESHDGVMISHDKVMQEEKREEEKREEEKITKKEKPSFGLDSIFLLYNIGIPYLQAFIDYRKKIKKPIKTRAPISSFAKELDIIRKNGIRIEDAINLMHDHEWQTIKLEWVKKSMPKKSSLDLSDKVYKEEDF